MAQSFTNFKDLIAYLENQLPISLELIGEEIKEMLRNNIQQLWYDQYQPQYYTRTYEYINSLRVSKAKKIGNGYEVEIYFAYDLIQPYPAENGEWSKHESIVNGQDVSAAIPHYVEYGNNSSLFNLESVHPGGLHIVEDMKNWLRQYDFLRKQIAIFLGEKGFVCSIK